MANGAVTERHAGDAKFTLYVVQPNCQGPSLLDEAGAWELVLPLLSLKLLTYRDPYTCPIGME